ncbi:hypothetical protein BJ912DRAFT_1144436 [Pholiota molesta]|nr:hypothetical protein BJ912DRAFT_1144436 [Pholiota molesta]
MRFTSTILFLFSALSIVIAAPTNGGLIAGNVQLAREAAATPSNWRRDPPGWKREAQPKQASPTGPGWRGDSPGWRREAHLLLTRLAGGGNRNPLPQDGSKITNAVNRESYRRQHAKQ